jgi:hypothetical protein
MSWLREPAPALHSLALLASFQLPACSALEDPTVSPKATPFTVVVQVRDDAGRPVSGAEVSAGKAASAKSVETGAAELKLTGNEGDSVALSVRCPEHYTSPEKAVTVTLRRLAAGSPVPKFDAICTARVHTTLVGIRTENGQGLPIVHQGKVVSQTDEAGTAHFQLTLPPNETVVLSFDTRDKAALRPQNPSVTFRTSDRDELVLLEQKFTVYHKRVVVKAADRPKPL